MDRHPPRGHPLQGWPLHHLSRQRWPARQLRQRLRQRRQGQPVDGQRPGPVYVPFEELDQFALVSWGRCDRRVLAWSMACPPCLNAGFDRVVSSAARRPHVVRPESRGGGGGPRRLRENARPPPVHIQEVQVDQRASRRARPGRAARPRRLIIPLHGTQLHGSREGALQAPAGGLRSGLGRRRRLPDRPVQQLAPGTYTFQVIAANGEGVWNQQGARWCRDCGRTGTRLAVPGCQCWRWAGRWRGPVPEPHAAADAPAGAELEQRVAERTAELATANQELEPSATRSPTICARRCAHRRIHPEVLRRQGRRSLDRRAASSWGGSEGSAERMAR